MNHNQSDMALTFLSPDQCSKLSPRGAQNNRHTVNDESRTVNGSLSAINIPVDACRPYTIAVRIYATFAEIFCNTDNRKMQSAMTPFDLFGIPRALLLLTQN
jgi:hypothetical protein